MHRKNYVCFRCRYTTKQSSKCPYCQQETINVGCRWRMPPKNKKKEWIDLVEIMKDYNVYFKDLLKDVKIK